MLVLCLEGMSFCPLYKNVIEKDQFACVMTKLQLSSDFLLLNNLLPVSALGSLRNN